MIKFVRRTGKSSRSPKASIKSRKTFTCCSCAKGSLKCFTPFSRSLTRQALYDPGITTGLFLKSDSSGTNLYKRTVCWPALFMKTPYLSKIASEARIDISSASALTDQKFILSWYVDVVEVTQAKPKRTTTAITLNISVCRFSLPITSLHLHTSIRSLP